MAEQIPTLILQPSEVCDQGHAYFAVVVESSQHREILPSMVLFEGLPDEAGETEAGFLRALNAAATATNTMMTLVGESPFDVVIAVVPPEHVERYAEILDVPLPEGWDDPRNDAGVE